MRKNGTHRMMAAAAAVALAAGLLSAGAALAEEGQIQIEEIQVEDPGDGQIQIEQSANQQVQILQVETDPPEIKSAETKPAETEPEKPEETETEPEETETEPGETEQTEMEFLPAERAQSDQVRNILLIGTDHRSDSWNGNSDVMILATVRPEEQKITLTSFMRDLYADIPEHGVHKLNYAFAVGGGELLQETLEDNYEIEIDNYAVVDFQSMAEIVDIAGGVEMEISDAECKWLNGYLNSMEAWDDYLPGGGTYVLNGNQAVAYMRIRFVGNNDYERTQRQRDILKGIFEKFGDLGPGQLLRLASELLEEVEHDFSLSDMLELLALVPDLPEYELEESRIPYDDLFDSQNEMLVPDFEATIERLHEDLGL